MSDAQTTINALDGYVLAASVFEPDPKDRMPITVIVNSATAVPQRFYARFAEHLASNGLRTITYDYRGIGRSLEGSLKGIRASAQIWAQSDYAGVLAWATRECAPDRIVVVGHSIGGQIVGLVPESQQARAIVNVSAQSGYWGHWPAPRKYLYAALWYALMPATTGFLGYYPGRRMGLGENLPRGVALEWARWCRSPTYFVDSAGASLTSFFDRFTNDVLSLWIDDDAFAPKASVEDINARYEQARVTVRRIESASAPGKAIGHFGFFRQSVGGIFWPDVVDWIRDTCDGDHYAPSNEELG